MVSYLGEIVQKMNKSRRTFVSDSSRTFCRPDPTRLLLESTYTSQKEVLFRNQETFIRFYFF